MRKPNDIINTTDADAAAIKKLEDAIDVALSKSAFLGVDIAYGGYWNDFQGPIPARILLAVLRQYAAEGWTIDPDPMRTLQHPPRMKDDIPVTTFKIRATSSTSSPPTE